MEGPQHFTAVLHRWAEVFMRRSMHDFMRFKKEAGLSMSQLSTLMRLYHHGGCVVSDIADSLDVSNAAASQMVERLVNLGLIERTEDPEDRRVKQITLTMKGRQLIQDSINAQQRWITHHKRIKPCEGCQKLCSFVNRAGKHNKLFPITNPRKVSSDLLILFGGTTKQRQKGESPIA
jgi:DNA-binding MarR family transcriptional regulator